MLQRYNFSPKLPTPANAHFDSPANSRIEPIEVIYPVATNGMGVDYANVLVKNIRKYPN